MRVGAALLALVVVSCDSKPASVGEAGSPPAHAAPSIADAASLQAEDAPSDAGDDRDRSALRPPRVVDKGLCTAITRPGGMFPQFVALRDLRVSFVDGDDLLAILNRSPAGSLPPDYAPTDLVELRGHTAKTARECETRHACLRREAESALTSMLDAMKKKGFVGRVESAYRSYASQCGVFIDWATKKKQEDPTAETTFCNASEQSALAGHSQHQLGTTLDLFTEEWFAEGQKDKEKKGSFRDGFGCTPAGRWLEETSWRFGFVLPYPIHPDDRQEKMPCFARWDTPVPPNPRTGYKNEPWHLRFIGVENAARFHEALVASAGEPGEETLEHWLRARAGLPGDADLPVCDGCSCGACATLAPREGDANKAQCGDASLWLDETGRPFDPGVAPRMMEARATRRDAGLVLVEVKIASAPHTLTQPPVTTDKGPVFTEGASIGALVPYRGRKPRAFPDLPRAWRLGVDPAVLGAALFPWRVSLAKDSLARTYNRANLYLPAREGQAWVRVVVTPPAGTDRLRVALLRDGDAKDMMEIAIGGQGVKRSE